MDSSEWRYTENLTLFQGPEKYTSLSVPVMFVVGGLFFLVVVWFQITNNQIPIIWSFVMIAIPFAVLLVGAALLLHFFRGYTLKVSRDGIYYRKPIDRGMTHIPIYKITNVEWDEGRASESDIYTMPSSRTIRTPEGLTTYACDPRSVGHGGAIPRQIDRGTEGVVRVDDAEGSTYLFATDRPEELTNAIENARKRGA